MSKTRTVRLFAMILLAGLALVAPACSDDDTNAPAANSSVSSQSASSVSSSSVSAAVTTATTVSSGVLLDGVTVTSAGTVYMTDIATGDIYQVTSSGEAVVVATSSAGPVHPDGITVVTTNGQDTIYVADTGTGTLAVNDPVASGSDGTVVAINPQTGSVTTVIDSTVLDSPAGIAADGAGNLYIADQGAGQIFVATMTNGVLEKIEPLAVTNLVEPHGLTLVDNGNGSVTLYTTDYANDNVVKIEVPLAGEPAATVLTPSSENGTRPGNADFHNRHGITTDDRGAVFVADEDGNRIAVITPGGNVVNLAGTGSAGSAGGDGAVAQFSDPCGLTRDKDGSILVCDKGNGKVRKIAYR